MLAQFSFRFPHGSDVTEVWVSDHVATVAGLLPVLNTTQILIKHCIYREKLDMKERFSQQQIIGFLKQAEAGVTVNELCRKHGGDLQCVRGQCRRFL